jgi:flagellar motor switch protein FliG
MTQTPSPSSSPTASNRDLASYTGVERAAIILLSLGEHAQTIWKLLDEEEVKEIGHAMSSLGVVPAVTVEALIMDFVEKLSVSGSIMGSFEQTQKLLAAMFPKDRVDSLMEEIRGPAGRKIWDKLANVDEVLLANYLKNEYPQTVAVVLSKIKSSHAAKVLANLPEEFATECVLRMLRMEPVHRDMLEKIEKTLSVEFMSSLARSSRKNPQEAVAEIFNSFDRQTETRFFAALEERHRDSAEQIRALMFVFEDLKRLDAGGVQTVLRQADKGDLAMALKGASDELRNLFLSNMSERGAKLMREDMAALGPVRLREVDQSQSRIVELVKDLAARGEIEVSEAEDEDELIH